MAGPIAENANGDRVMWNGSAWVPLGNSRAPGASFLPATPATPDKSEAAYWRTYRDKDNVNVSQARSGLADARRMEGLLARQKTGGIYGVPVLGAVAGFMDPEIREMDAIQSKAARQNRTPGDGAISDFDAQQFLAMTYGKDKPTETNRALIQALRVANDAAIQRRQFMQRHYGTYGTVNGAEEAWDRYAQDNPIFDPSSEATGKPALNGKRRDWRTYFGAPGQGRATQAQTDIERSVGAGQQRKPFRADLMPPKQLAAARMFSGAKAAAGTKANPYVPTSMDEFKKIPPGAWVIDDDGTVFQKPGGR